jgi:hypothetical protein
MSFASSNNIYVEAYRERMRINTVVRELELEMVEEDYVK